MLRPEALLLRVQYPPLLHRVIFLTGDTLGAESTAFLAQWVVSLSLAANCAGSLPSRLCGLFR